MEFKKLNKKIINELNEKLSYVLNNDDIYLAEIHDIVFESVKNEISRLLIDFGIESYKSKILSKWEFDTSINITNEIIKKMRLFSKNKIDGKNEKPK